MQYNTLYIFFYSYPWPQQLSNWISVHLSAYFHLLFQTVYLCFYCSVETEKTGRCRGDEGFKAVTLKKYISLLDQLFIVHPKMKMFEAEESHKGYLYKWVNDENNKDKL